MAIGLWTACCVAGRYSDSTESFDLNDTDSTNKRCGNCGKENPTMVTVPSFNPPLEVELVLRRWKDGDASIDDVFNGIEKFATEDFFSFIRKIRPPEALSNKQGLEGQDVPMPLNREELKVTNHD